MTTDEIQVSVSCLAYNHEKYIRKCLDGFVMQKTNFRFEVIVHDDASTDGTAAIIREYAQKYPDIIKPIFQTENQYSQGVNIDQTYVFPRMKGKYLACCEGDDYWCDENKLQMQYDAMEAHPECSICVHRVQVVNEEGIHCDKTYPSASLEYGYGYVDTNQLCAELIERFGYPFQTSSYFIKFEIVQRLISMRKSIYFRLNGDMAILLAALDHGKVFYIASDMSCYRRGHANSWSANRQKYTKEQKENYDLQCVKSLLSYDAYTNKKYTKYIEGYVVNTLLGQDNIRKFTPYRTFAWEYVRNKRHSKISRIKVLLWYIHPRLFRLVQKIKSGM